MGNIIYEIDWKGWVFMGLAALFVLTYNIFRQIAVKYDSASKVTLYNYA
jgi:hypothetical protein